MALTKRGIDRLNYDPDGPKQQIRFDSELPGFGVRVFPSGVKSFVIWYRSRGQKRLMTIGRYGAMTLHQARERARRVIVDAGDGRDPLSERRDDRSGMSLGEFASVYLERHARPHKKTWREDERRLGTHLLSRWGGRRLDSIGRADVAKLHAAIGSEHRHEANRVLALVSIIFAKAIEWAHLPTGSINPASGIKQFREPSRDRWLGAAEVSRLLVAVEEEENPYHRAAFKLYLLVGCRRSELLSLRWGDIDLERCTLFIRETKANRPHLLPLSAAAVTIVSELPREHDNPYLFPSPVLRGSHLADLKRPWNRIRKRAGLTDIHLHDLRRTVGSMLAMDGASLQLIGKILNHSETRTTEVYARLTEDTTRDALERHGDNIVNLAEWKGAQSA